MDLFRASDLEFRVCLEFRVWCKDMFRYKRSERVKELLREEISLYVQNIHDPGLGFVTITEVKLSNDLRHARLYISVIGDDEQKKNTHAILLDHIQPLRKLLGKKLSLQRIPEIKLMQDDISEKASRIFSLLDQIKAEEKLKNPPDQKSHEESSG